MSLPSAAMVPSVPAFGALTQCQGTLDGLAVVYLRTEPGLPRSSLKGLHVSAAFKLLWETRNLLNLRALHLGPKYFPDPWFSGVPPVLPGSGSRVLIISDSVGLPFLTPNPRANLLCECDGELFCPRV